MENGNVKKTGFFNPGYMCFMNSAVQCLSHTSELATLLRNNEESLEACEITKNLTEALKRIEDGWDCVSLLPLKNTFERYHPQFRGTEQQDSHEFLLLLLDAIHDETSAFEDPDGTNISELFQGLKMSKLICTVCNNVSETFEPFYTLSLPIPDNGENVSLQNCLDLFKLAEYVEGWVCSHCNIKVAATKRSQLTHLPKYLIIHLQRFRFGEYWQKQIIDVDFPHYGMNLNSIMTKFSQTEKEGMTREYNLKSVVNHCGSLDDGHFTAICWDNMNGGWWEFDDQNVKAVDASHLSRSAAYMLFYQRCD